MKEKEKNQERRGKRTIKPLEGSELDAAYQI